jgi:hypothetical protein
MQINLDNSKFKKAFLYLGWILLFLLLFFRGCSNGQEKTKTTITIPEIYKQLPTSTVVKHEKINGQKKTNKNEEKYLKDLTEAEQRIIAYQEEIDNMQSEFQWGDSIKQAEMYRLATELKKFESNFEDEHLKLTINGIIAGNQVKEITPTYTIKAKKIDVVQKQVKFRMLVGGGLGINKDLNQSTYKFNAGFQNQKGNIIRGSFQRIGNQDYYLAEYDFSLFKISR